MAKEGIDSFLLDCHTNDNISEIEAEFGVKGFAVVVRLWQKIYGEKGYYCEWIERSPLLFLAKWFGGNSGVTISLITEIVDRCLNNGIFDVQMYEKYSILTSARIQKQYFDVVKRREEILVKKEYLLISVDKIKGIVCKNMDSACRTDKNAYKNSTSKEKESEVKEEITVSKDTVRQTEVRRAVEVWNKLEACGIARVSKLNASSQRYKMLSARISEYGIEDVLRAIDKVAGSRFLQGKSGGGRQWQITFDWFVRPNNFPKVLDGNYDDKKSGYDNQGPVNSDVPWQ